MPIDTAMFIKASIFQGHRNARQPRTHFLESDRELSARFERRELGNFTTAAIK